MPQDNPPKKAATKKSLEEEAREIAKEYADDQRQIIEKLRRDQ